MTIHTNFTDREWQPELPYRPIGQAFDSAGRSCTLLTKEDLQKKFSEMSTMQKTRYIFSLPGICMRYIASCDKPYLQIDKPENSTAQHKEKETLTVLSLNAACLPSWITEKYNNLRSTEVRADEIAQTINEMDEEEQPDVLCFQEVFAETASQTLRDKLKEKYPYVIHHAGNNYVGFNSGLCIFSKYPIEKANFQKYRNLIGEDAFTNKGFLSADIKVGNKSVKVYTTHTQAGGYSNRLKRFDYFSPEKVRGRQFEPLYEDVKNANKTHDAVIVTGDFNLFVSDKLLKEVPRPENPKRNKPEHLKEKEATHKAFFDLFHPYKPKASKGSSSTGTTYTTDYLKSHKQTQENLAENDKDETKGLIIDACFVTKDSKAFLVSAEISRLFTNASDHLAIIAKVRLNAS